MDSFAEFLRDYHQPGSYPEHWALREMERVVGADALASSPSSRHAEPEWDPILSMPPKVLRRLRGAGFMRRGAMQPDVLAALIIDRVPEVETIDDAMRWYVRTALEAIEERRRERHHARHLRVAKSCGHRTYYEHRSEYARSLGYRSLYDMRKAKGW